LAAKIGGVKGITLLSIGACNQLGKPLRPMAMGVENGAPREAELRPMQDLLTEGPEAGASTME
jgi:N-acyl-D-amino-acid deacylase